MLLTKATYTAEEVAIRIAGLACGGYAADALREATGLIEQYGLQCEERWAARIKLLEARNDLAAAILRGDVVARGA